jgi:hypothetical protein
MGPFKAGADMLPAACLNPGSRRGHERFHEYWSRTQLFATFGDECFWHSLRFPRRLKNVTIPSTPAGYDRQGQARVRERFESAVELAEHAFAPELQRLTAHLAERLTGLHAGQPKVFRDSAVENLRDFFERFRRLNIRSSPELDSLVEQAQQEHSQARGCWGCGMTTEMELVVGNEGDVRCISDEALDLRTLGKLQITRASHVEPDAEGYGFADMGPVDGPVLGPFTSRTEAFGAERVWLLGQDK